MSKHIQKILIANRAEIAVRIMKTCRKRGIQTVGLYTVGEENLPHVQFSDEAILLEGEELSDTYLNADKLIQIAQSLNCDAIHPGYGFLSENAAFAKAVTEAGLQFIGPTADVIDLMGDKKQARDVAEKAGVPLVPGFSPAQFSIEEARVKAQELGYPVLIKATAGGGGKGMRIVHETSEFDNGLRQAAAEAKSASGHDEVLVEKYLVEPRHIEVQVLCDTHGQAFHLLERDCSVQRRHQKVVEESPAFGLTKEAKEVLFSTAIALCKEVGYVNAGTIEFIMDKDQKVYFLEMNTRLQVEHPVSELVTGFDLVSLQIDVAEGKKLHLVQDEISARGHALELRLYAEDPQHNFLPTSGNLSSFHFPNWPNVRIDTGYAEGEDVTNSFDPMIAKLIFYGMDRNDCLNLAASYLDSLSVSGFPTNIFLLKRIVEDNSFRTKAATTHFLAEREDLFEWTELSEEENYALIAASLLFKTQANSGNAQTEGNAMDATYRSVWKNTSVGGFRNV
jgi:acetyl/propionyl-CoA carboxylase alpha subunit